MNWKHRAKTLKLYDNEGYEIVNKILHIEEYNMIVSLLKELCIIEE